MSARNLITIGLLISGSALLAACNSSQPVTPSPAVPVTPEANTQSSTTALPQSTPNSPPPASTAAIASISISNFQFSPASITVKQGTTVTWTNNDSASHTITGDAGGPASNPIATGQQYSYTFSGLGTFGYHCSIHPSMTATVIVTP